MKWLFVLIVVGVIGYIVYVNQSTPQTPEALRAAAMTGPTSVAKYYCEAAIRGNTSDMDSVCTPQGAGSASNVIQILREEERSQQTTATDALAIVGGGAGTNVRDAKMIFRDANEDMVFVISVIRTEKQANGEWRITHVSIN